MSTDQRELSISSLVNVLPSQGFRDEQAARCQPPCMPKHLCAYLLTPGQRRHAANAFGLVCSFFQKSYALWCGKGKVIQVQSLLLLLIPVLLRSIIVP